MTTDRPLRRLATAGVAGPLGFWVVLFGLGGLTPGYSPVHDYISTLGAVGAPYAVVQQANFVLFGASILAFGVGIHRYFGDGRRPRAGTVFVGLLGLGVLHLEIKIVSGEQVNPIKETRLRASER